MYTEHVKFIVPWQSETSKRNKNVSVKVAFVKAIDHGSLEQLLAGDEVALNPESEGSNAMNMLNIFVQMTPKMREPRIHNANSVFTPFYRESPPLELWRGYFQSVRPTSDKVIVNVDVTVGVIVPARKLEALCGNYLSLPNNRDLSNLKGSQFQLLRTFLRGLKVEIDLPGHRTRRPQSIKDLVRNVGAEMFDRGGSKISVADYFQMMRYPKILPNTLGVQLGRAGLFPITLCATAQQLYKNSALPEIVREMMAFSPADPMKRFEAIEDGREQLQYGVSPLLVGAGISVASRPVDVRGRILPSPAINFGSKTSITLQRPGVWDVMKKSLVHPVELKRWTAIDFGLCDPDVLDLFIEKLMKAMVDRGMIVPDRPKIFQKNGHADIEKILSTLQHEGNLKMILVILPESAPHLYMEVKRFGDVTHGVATQCVRWTSKLARDTIAGRCDQYHNNLILKINAKLGGINFYPVNNAMSFLRSKPTMVLGADVSHPRPGSSLPSIAALVASLDFHASRYVASIRVQASRVEMIEDIGNMFDSAIQKFRKVHNLLPQNIFFFRDGVSEGEFMIVRDRELSAIKVVLQKHYGLTLPALVFIVVGKRHHFRFFPPQSPGGDVNGNRNMHSGFVVDRDIVHPVYPDFYLQSQPGLKGTSVPSHYTVLRNDLELPLDYLQQIAYSLCHCYSRSTRSVKIPAPVYYADLVCRRAKFHFDNEVHNIDDASAGSDDKPHVDFYKDHFTAINSRMADTMYFV